MPKKNPTKPTPKKGKQPRRMRLNDGLKFAVIFIIVAVSVNTLAQHWEARQDKARLEKADKQMQIVMESVKKELGEPAYEKHTKSCSFPNLKFMRGQLTCGTNYFVVYGAQDKADIIERAENIKLGIGKSGVTNVKSDVTSGQNDQSRNWLSARLFLSDINKIGCWGNVESDDTSRGLYGEEYSQYVASPAIIGFSFGCTEPTPKPFYELNED